MAETEGVGKWGQGRGQGALQIPVDSSAWHPARIHRRAAMVKLKFHNLAKLGL